MRLNIPAGTAVRFEPGQTRDVTLVALAGKRTVYGFRQDVWASSEFGTAASGRTRMGDTSIVHGIVVLILLFLLTL